MIRVDNRKEIEMEKEKKTDRRVRKTRSQLRSGLARLMMKKTVAEITVKELVDEVDINRSTFYLHYADISSLLREVEGDMLKEIESAIERHPMTAERDTLQLLIEDVFRVLADNREVACALVGPYGDIGFIRQIEQLLEDNSRKTLAATFPEKYDKMGYYYSFCMNGLLGFVKKWLEEGSDMSFEHAARLTYQMVISSLKAFCEDGEGQN